MKKSKAWRLAAGHLEAICQDKASEGHASDDREAWEHIAAVIVPFLDRKARQIEDRERRKWRA